LIQRDNPLFKHAMAASRQATIAGVVVLVLLKALQRVRVEPAPLCQAVGLEVTSLEDPNARVSTGLVTRLLALAEHRARDPWVGLHAGEYAQPRGPLFYMILSSPRIAEGLRRAQRFSGLAIDKLRLVARTERGLARLVFDVGDAALSASRHAMEYLLMASVSAIRHAIGAGFGLREVHFRHRRVGRLNEAERSFGCPVYFGQPDDSIAFPHSTLWTVPRFANRSIAQEIAKFAAALSARIAPRATISERAEQATRALLASGNRANTASVGRRLGMSSRTLQRKLTQEGTNFRALRDGVLWEAVEVLLSNSSLKIEAIALSVGFSDVAAFSKAFRRCKGYPPTRYRQRLASSRGARLPVAAIHSG
jgi:AraC-like DNA-binding protein